MFPTVTSAALPQGAPSVALTRTLYVPAFRPVIFVPFTGVQLVPSAEYSIVSLTPVMVPSSEAPSAALVEPSPVGAAGREESVTGTQSLGAWLSSDAVFLIYTVGVVSSRIEEKSVISVPFSSEATSYPCFADMISSG